LAAAVGWPDSFAFTYALAEPEPGNAQITPLKFALEI
jgi:hypothetical protein